MYKYTKQNIVLDQRNNFVFPKNGMQAFYMFYELLK